VMFVEGGSVKLGLGFFIDIFFEQVYQDFLFIILLSFSFLLNFQECLKVMVYIKYNASILIIILSNKLIHGRV